MAVASQQWEISRSSVRRGICCEETQPDESSTFRVAAPQGAGLLAIGNQRKRKSWSFERLEDRLCFSLRRWNCNRIIANRQLSPTTRPKARRHLLHEMQWARLAGGHDASGADDQ